MSVMVLPVAVLTADEGLVALEVDIAEDGAVVRRGTDDPIDLVSLVKLIDREVEPELAQLELELLLD